MQSNIIIEKLEGIKIKFEEVAQQITDPEVIHDVKRYIKLNKDYHEMEPLMEVFEEYKNVLDNIYSTKDILSNEKDDELREMAKSEMVELETKERELEERIKFLFLPSDPEDNKNAIMEIRAGTGG